MTDDEMLQHIIEVQRWMDRGCHRWSTGTMLAHVDSIRRELERRQAVRDYKQAKGE